MGVNFELSSLKASEGSVGSVAQLVDFGRLLV